MNVPPGQTKESVTEIIERVVNALAGRFTFGIHSEDDIKQELWVIALQALTEGRYDPSRPLDKFLYIHLRNRISNFKRDHFHRSDPPCRLCNEGKFCTENGACKKFREWKRLNSSKANLQQPADIDRIADEDGQVTGTPSKVCDDASMNDVLARIDANLPIELRQTYLQMRSGMTVPKSRRDPVEDAIKRIVCQSD